MLHHEIEDASDSLSFSAMSLDDDQHSSSMSGLSPNGLQAPRPLRRCRSASPATHRVLNLVPEQQRLIRQSWNRIPKWQFAKSVLTAFFRACHAPQLIFPNQETEQRHIKYIVELVQSCVGKLDNLEEGLKPLVELLGRGHSNFRITGPHWEKFAEALMSVASEYNGPGRRHRDIGRAWMLLSSFLADRLAHASRTSHQSPMLTPRVQLLTGRSALE
ncbi:Protein CBR-GLB-28 [Caenorhabditis briggsae]|uniref:Protein CBR-GLB-28 n=1 Tax=Caenorhabditis briggsae TaxID=6238 RepID=A8X4A9_CAEBR|nr:Protein CBR-GLB-28 [Caenorhabditis briggsae]CAP27469.2 Protein CBR-GLB-28 [Caenorhabditis briggsae]